MKMTTMQSGILVSTTDLRQSLMSILKGLDEALLLKEVVTTVAIDPDNILGKCVMAVRNIIPSGFAKGIDRRILPEFLRGKSNFIFIRELARLVASKLASDVFTHRVWLWAELGFDREVARRFSGHFRYIYGMEHSSLETFARQKELGGSCILRQVMSHGRTSINIIKDEIEKFPEYSTPYLRLFPGDIERSVLRKEAEYRLADLIIANSRFVRDSFVKEGVNPEKIVYIPTGCPPVSNIKANAGRGNKSLIFLFAGMLALRKGLPYLVKAWSMLNAEKTAELWLVGRQLLPDIAFKEKGKGIKYFGAVSQSELAKIYERADVLVMPTLLEGCAHVVLEALSHSLPVITTEESGCGGFVQNGKNGFIIKAADADAICGAMNRCLEHRDKLEGMGRASAELARSWTVGDSNRAHLDIIQEFLKKGLQKNQ